MDASKNPLRVEFGTIYTQSGRGIDQIAVILDTDYGSVMKYGDAEKVQSYYGEMIEKYRKTGFEEEAENYMLITFDRYDGVLSIEEICTLVNYMIQVSANPRLMTILKMPEGELKKEIKKLQEFGF